MPIKVRNSSGDESEYRALTYADYLKSLGLAAAEAREVALAIPPVLIARGVERVGTEALRRIAHDVSSLGTAAVALDAMLRRDDASPSERGEKEEKEEKRPVRAAGRRRPLFEVPILPWLSQASVVAPVNRPLAETLQTLASFARAVGEGTARERLEDVLQHLLEAGMTTEAAERLRERTFVGALPVGPETYLARLGKLTQQLREKGDLLEEDPAGSVGCALLLDSRAGFTSVAPLPTGRYWSTGTSIEELPRHLRDDGLYIEIGEGGIGVVAVGSAERTFTASGSNYAAVCITPVTSDDDLEAKDVTYQGLPQMPYENDDLPFVSSPTPVPPPGYHPEIESKLIPDAWAENVEVGLNTFVYSFTLTEKNNFPYASQLNELVKKNDEKIKEAIDDVAEKAGTAAKGLLAGSPAAPLSSLGEQIAKQVTKQALKLIYDEIKDLFGDAFFPPVRIVHVVNYQPPALPESIFVLDAGGSGETRLYAMERDPQRPNIKSKLKEKGGEPHYPLGNGRSRRFQRMGRTMVGYSRPPGGVVPLDLWKAVGQRKAAAEWASAAAGQGFHVIVSLPEQGGSGNYVWALRADLYALTSEGKVAYVV